MIAPAPRAVRAAGLAALLLLTACGTDADDTRAAQEAGYTPITVYAAASLQEVFDEIGGQVSQQTGADIRFTYAGSSDLATQLGEGAPGDVFASANERQMEAAIDSGAVRQGADRLFATNTLTVVTPSDNPAGVASLTDLAGASTVVCAPQVPCGAATAELLETTGVRIDAVSEEQSVTDVLGKVTSGQADAGLVYVTDATRAGDGVRIIDTPEAAGIVNRYPIAVTAHGAQDEARRATAEAFVDAVLGEEGRQILREAGFGQPAS